MTDKLKELALAAKEHLESRKTGATSNMNAWNDFCVTFSPDAILALIKRAEDAKADADHNKQQAIALAVNTEDLRADLENERHKVTELVDGYEKDQAELKRLRSTIFTDNTQTLVNAEKEIERLNVLIMETATQYNKALQDTQADVERLTLEKKAAAMNYEAVIEGLKAQVERLKAALDKLARLGNEPHYGNSVGNDIARAALASGAATKEKEE